VNNKKIEMANIKKPTFTVLFLILADLSVKLSFQFVDLEKFPLDETKTKQGHVFQITYISANPPEE